MGIHSILVAWLLSAVSTFAAVTLIDSQTRNGSFEDGVASPWSSDVMIVQDAAFASHGSWYARFQATGPGGGTVRKIAFQFLPGQKTNGQSFVATFDARIGTIGFNSLHVYLFARNTNGTFIGTTPPSLFITNLSSSMWNHHEISFDLAEGWDGVGQLSLQLLYSQTPATNGTTYVGYLDNITLRQFSEPRLEIAFASSSQVALSWRTNAVNYILESRSMAMTGAWSQVPAAPTIVGQKFTVIVSALEANHVFRLRK